jgi:hypothetical protein
VETFLAACADWLDPSSMEKLGGLTLFPAADDSFPSDSAAVRWHAWETVLRNRLARQRAALADRDPAPMLRPESDVFSEIDRGVQDAYAMANPLERERSLDRMRWHRLDDLESGHLFDFDFLCIYKIKLMINGKWRERDFATGSANFDEAVRSIEASGASAVSARA